MRIKLGNKVKDLVTEFKGFAVEKRTYINGCTQFKVSGEYDQYNENMPSITIDIQQLAFVDDGYAKHVPQLPSNPNIVLGNVIKDPITKFEGIASALVERLDGSVYFATQGKMSKGKDGIAGHIINIPVLTAIKVSDGIIKEIQKNRMSDEPTVEEKKKGKSRPGGPSRNTSERLKNQFS